MGKVGLVGFQPTHLGGEGFKSGFEVCDGSQIRAHEVIPSLQH
jgi:hypothetical protein